MDVLYSDLLNRQVFPDGLQRLHPSITRSQTSNDRPLCVEDVIITAEFQRRKTRPENPAVELAAFKHLTNFLSTSPFNVLHQLAAVLMKVCDAGSAGITLEERRGTMNTLQCVGAAGQLASTHLEQVAQQSPCGRVVDTWRTELFRRPKRFFAALTQGEATIEELLVMPWELSSGRRGAIWLAHHDPHSHFDPEDLRLVTTLGDFARHALQRSHSEETRRSCETLASATRVANQLAHEVNNPLQALINSLYLIPRGPQDEHLDEACLQAARVTELVRTVLEISREPDPAPPDTTRALNSVPMTSSK